MHEQKRWQCSRCRRPRRTDASVSHTYCATCLQWYDLVEIVCDGERESTLTSAGTIVVLDYTGERPDAVAHSELN